MRNIILILLILVGLYSCNNKDNNESNTINKSAFLPMSDGNYWVYQYYVIDSNGIEYPENYYDSVVITNDTSINGKKYFRYDFYEDYRENQKPDFSRSVYYFDSSKCLVNNFGRIVFSEDNFVDTICRVTQLNNSISGDTIGWTTFKMERMDGIVIVPAGSFSNLLNYRGTFVGNPKHCSISKKYTNQYYSKNVGLILSSFFYDQPDPNSNEKRLLRYKINK